MRLALLAAGLLALAGCGRDEGGKPASPSTDLHVVVWPEGRGGRTLEATLTCEPAGGDHPAPAAACRALAAHTDALEPVSRDAVCTQIFGGADEATVDGTLDGRPVRASFNKRNGCELARWQRLEPLLSL